jgi:hypothetical protein
MSRTDSYVDKTFRVADDDARVRNPNSLLEFRRYTPQDTLPAGTQVGDWVRIGMGTSVKVDEIKIVPTGSSGSIIFVHAVSSDAATELGWTSSRNFEGGFVNETLGAIPPAAGAGKFGPNAAWQGGSYIRQLTLVAIVGADQQVKHISIDTLDPYLGLVGAAAKDSVLVAINSGFRSYPEQKYLYEGFTKGLHGFNKAAPPGSSNHQNGIAFDIAVAGGAGHPVYDWLTSNAPALGFIRTVNGEPWHWEYDTAKAKAAVKAHTFKTGNVKK